MKKKFGLLIRFGCVGLIRFVVQSMSYDRAAIGFSWLQQKLGRDYQTMSQSRLDTLQTYKSFSGIIDYATWCHAQQENCILMPHQQWYADMQWIGNIQYVGTVGRAQYPQYLYDQLMYLTQWSPYRDYPYVLGQLLIPQSAGMSGVNAPDTWKNAVALGQRAIVFNCDLGMQTGKICDDYRLPQTLGFTYFHHMGKIAEATAMYQLAASDDQSPAVTKIMPAIISSRLSNEEKSIYLRYDAYLSVVDSDETLATRYLYKTIFAYQLWLLGMVDKEVSCHHDYQCLVESGILSRSIRQQWERCHTSSGLTGDVLCAVLAEGIDAKFIKPDGSLVYPLDDGFVFVRDDQYTLWWIAKK